jgi:DNA polymerase iota
MRAVIHVDVDCFYVQVELLRNPRICTDRPVAVTQKFLCVTSNYAARAAGVGKLMRIDEARRICPDLVLIPGEDLTPYREASSQILSVLSAFGPTQKLGLDEFFVDVTESARASLLPAANTWAESCRVHRATHGTRSSESLEGRTSNYRPQDLRASSSSAVAQPSAEDDGGDDDDGHDASVPLLRGASHVALECKRAIRSETGLTVSVGVACSKTLAKLTSGLHKPDGLSALPQEEAHQFLSPLDVRVLPGVGSAAASRLHEIGARTVGEVSLLDTHSLQRALGRSPTIGAARLSELSHGIDTEPVVQSGPPKSLSVEDSFKGVSSLEKLSLVLQVLAPDLLRRLDADRQRYARRPRSLVVRIRHAGSRTMNRPEGAASGSSTVRSTPMPHKLSAASDADARAALLIEASLVVVRDVLRDSLRSGFCLTLLGLGATNFESLGSIHNGRGTNLGSTASASCNASSLMRVGSQGGRVMEAGHRASPGSAAAAAEAQRRWRADYGGGGGGSSSDPMPPTTVPVSKAEERLRRETGQLADRGSSQASSGIQGGDGAPMVAPSLGANGGLRGCLARAASASTATASAASLTVPNIEICDEFWNYDEYEDDGSQVYGGSRVYGGDEAEDLRHQDLHQDHDEFHHYCEDHDDGFFIDDDDDHQQDAQCPICGSYVQAKDNAALNLHIDACLGQAPQPSSLAHAERPCGPATATTTTTSRSPHHQGAAARKRARAETSGVGVGHRDRRVSNGADRGQQTLLSSWKSSTGPPAD